MFRDGMFISGKCISGIFRLMGSVRKKASLADVGNVVASGRLNAVATDDLLGGGLSGGSPNLAWPTATGASGGCCLGSGEKRG